MAEFGRDVGKRVNYPLPALTISEVSDQTGLSPDTLRYYEKVGLIEHVGRTSGNHRCYAASDLEWLAFLLRLRQTGMSIEDMRHFAQLRGKGMTTVVDRLDLLREHSSSLEKHIRSLRQSAKALDHKINYYEELLAKQQKRKHT